MMESRPLINCDWLAYNCECWDDTPNDNYNYVEGTATNVFGRRIIYYDNFGYKLCTVLSRPRSAILSPKMMLVEVANEHLYDGTRNYDLWRSFYPHSRLVGLSRVDFCADFEVTPRRLSIIQGLASGDFYVKGKKQTAAFYDVVDRERVAKCINYGSPRSEMTWKIYNKTLELNATSPDCEKPYIVQRWNEVGFDVSKVWRLEVSLHPNRFTFAEELGDVMSHRDEFERYFLSLMAKSFDVRVKGHSRVANDKHVEFFPADARLSVRRRVSVPIKRKPLVAELSKLVAAWELQPCATPIKAKLFEYVCDFATEYGLESYCERRWGVKV